MPLDDEDTPTKAVPTGTTAEEDGLEQETQDFSQFAALTGRTQFSAQAIRKGEKDFESHGTRAQQDAIERSRRVMEEVLSHTRVHRPGSWVRGWYFPDTWADAPLLEEEEEGPQEEHGDESGLIPGGSSGEGGEKMRRGATRRPGADGRRRPAQARDRVVVVEEEKGSIFYSVGRHIPGAARDQPGARKLWLLPEEALFLVERGSLDLWWPLRPLRDIFPPPATATEDGGGEQAAAAAALPPMHDEEYEMGLPLSLQAAYSLLIGRDGERGKISLQKYQVYSSLKRAGYYIMRSAPLPRPAAAPQPPSPPELTLWQWLVSSVARSSSSRRGESAAAPPPLGPLVRPGLYRSYRDVYARFHIIPRHKPGAVPWRPGDEEEEVRAEEPFRVQFHLWRSSQASWTRTRTPAPDFHLAVVDAQDSSVPTLQQISALLASTPAAPPASGGGPARLYQRLRQGHRNVLVAVVDHGIINIMRFADAAFGEEPLLDRFDARAKQPAAKKGAGFRGGRGRGRGRGGRARGGRGH